MIVLLKIILVVYIYIWLFPEIIIIFFFFINWKIKPMMYLLPKKEMLWTWHYFNQKKIITIQIILTESHFHTGSVNYT